jgi:hypothetical protein
MFQPTTDRDVRLSDDQMKYLDFAIRDELKRRRTSIKRAEANRAAGQTIQHGTLDEHHKAVAALLEAREIFDVARRQIRHQQHGY